MSAGPCSAGLQTGASLDGGRLTGAVPWDRTRRSGDQRYIISKIDNSSCRNRKESSAEKGERCFDPRIIRECWNGPALSK